MEKVPFYWWLNQECCSGCYSPPCKVYEVIEKGVGNNIDGTSFWLHLSHLIWNEDTFSESLH